jgi:hypothetical protein
MEAGPVRFPLEDGQAPLALDGADAVRALLCKRPPLWKDG